MQWILAVGALVGLVAVRMFAARRVNRGDRRFVWLLFAPTLLFAFAPIGAGVILLSVQPVAGLLVGAASVVGAILLVRMVRAMASASGSQGDLDIGSGPALDYIVWGVLAVPLILGMALIVLLITGGLGDMR
jgi:hypothetical protein